jgi:hypothetical protein
LCLLLSANKEDIATVGYQISQNLSCSLKKNESLLQIYDVDAVPLREDKCLHAWLPPTGLMSKMDTRFQQRFHSHSLCHWWLRLSYWLSRNLWLWLSYWLSRNLCHWLSYWLSRDWWLRLGIRDCSLLRQEMQLLVQIVNKFLSETSGNYSIAIESEQRHHFWELQSS